MRPKSPLDFLERNAYIISDETAHLESHVFLVGAVPHGEPLGRKMVPYVILLCEFQHIFSYVIGLYIDHGADLGSS